MNTEKSIVDNLLSFIMGGDKSDYEFSSAREACDFLQDVKKQSIKYYIAFAVWGIGFILIAITGVRFLMENVDKPILTYGRNMLSILYFLLLIPLARKWIPLNRRARGCFHKLIMHAVQEVLPGAICEPNECIMPSKLYHLGVIPSYEEANGSFLIQYEKDGRKYSFSNIFLRNQVMECGATHLKETYVGQAYTAEYKSNLNGTVRIVSVMRDNIGRIDLRNHKPLDASQEQRIDTESIVFNENFEVYASDSQSAFYVLSPYVLEQLLLMKQQLGHFGLAISGSEIMIAFQTGHGFFQKPSTPEEIEALSLERIKQEIWNMTVFAQQIENGINGNINPERN